MNKAELINSVAATAEVSKKEAEAVITATLDAITAALKEGDPVPGVFLGGVGHGFRGNVHAGDVRGGLRQNMRAVAFAGGDIQDVLIESGVNLVGILAQQDTPLG